MKIAQFVDLNPNVQPFGRTYAKDVAKIYEIEQKLLFIRGQIEHSNVRVL